MNQMTEAVPIPQEIADMLKKANTGIVNDALALLGINGGIQGVRPARGFEDAKIIGRATTVKFGGPRPDSRKTNIFHIVRQSPPGNVVVYDGKGIDGHFAGDNHANGAKRAGFVGMVIYGGVRDVAGFRQLGLPVYCTGTATIDKPPGMQIVDYNVPVEIGGVTVNPNDIVIADEDGVVCIPDSALPFLAEKLQILFKFEESMEKAIGSDAPLEEIQAIVASKSPKKK
jgi:regulator of RNase E activity RraA